MNIKRLQATISNISFNRRLKQYEVDIKDETFVATVFLSKDQKNILDIHVGDLVIKLVETNCIVGFIGKNNIGYFQGNDK